MQIFFCAIVHVRVFTGAFVRIIMEKNFLLADAWVCLVLLFFLEISLITQRYIFSVASNLDIFVCMSENVSAHLLLDGMVSGSAGPYTTAYRRNGTRFFVQNFMNFHWITELQSPWGSHFVENVFGVACHWRSCRWSICLGFQGRTWMRYFKTWKRLEKLTLNENVKLRWSL